jgi:hypothetical protein
MVSLLVPNDQYFASADRHETGEEISFTLDRAVGFESSGVSRRSRCCGAIASTCTQASLAMRSGSSLGMRCSTDVPYVWAAPVVPPHASFVLTFVEWADHWAWHVWHTFKDASLEVRRALFPVRSQLASPQPAIRAGICKPSRRIFSIFWVEVERADHGNRPCAGFCVIAGRALDPDNDELVVCNPRDGKIVPSRRPIQIGRRVPDWLAIQHDCKRL